ncbi:uncharacterized protein PFL1_04625 [Pseudozyma flocculosa PF-1]|uniref:Zn(2)-C6 fungal-type domain-containing protein n=1 Tax=Pseudozyma flocculosa PF-1 TaxID=1277687 RepID=A0A061HBB5_9BASI|nr:uncharacterized protein PFL1_04625 [Pseudozyma flocculosa PF-1]EPQ27881.1 hypothetical protein PFL1_04625 [Pseudozyma flocculosa PF-1]
MATRYPASPRDSLRLPPPASLLRLASPSEPRNRDLPVMTLDRPRSPPQHYEHASSSMQGHWGRTAPPLGRLEDHRGRPSTARGRSPDFAKTPSYGQAEVAAGSSIATQQRSGVKRPAPDASPAAYAAPPPHERNMGSASRRPNESSPTMPPADIYYGAGPRDGSYSDHAAHDPYRKHARTKSYHSERSYEQLYPSPGSLQPMRSPGELPQAQHGSPASASAPTPSAYHVSPSRFSRSPSDEGQRPHDHSRERQRGTVHGSPHPLSRGPDSINPYHAIAVSRATEARGDYMQHQHQQQRKRLRISRACDECRRRKTRCDVVGAFPGEAGHPATIAGLVPPIEPHQEPQGDMLILQPCMNCRRSGITCSYSKRPLKRGPSKGYIKDLERRLNSLESQMVAPDGAASAVGAPSDTAAAKPKRSAKDAIMQSTLHATFPVVCYAAGESSTPPLESRMLSRGHKILAEALEPPPTSPSATGSEADHTRVPEKGLERIKNKPHSSRLAQIIGQASAGLASASGDLFSSQRTGRLDNDRLKSMRKLAADVAAQEADLLMLCQLDLLRHGQPNKSALAAAVTKLDAGDGSARQLRRRVVMFTMDRWHSAGFGTPHVVTGRHALDRTAFQTMKDALADVERSPLGPGSYEVVRASVMLGHLHDMAQSAGGWKHISPSDVDSIVHSVTNQAESHIAEGSQLDPTCDAALRYSLEHAVRTYHALHTLPPAGQATVEDIGRLFEMTERIIVLGKAKTPLTPASKLFRSAIGPHVAAMVAVSFFWCYKVIAILTAQAYGGSGIASPASASSASSSSSSSSTLRSRDRVLDHKGLVSASLQPLEHYRRKMSDYVRMVGMLCMFSGGAPDDAAAFKPLYLRLSLFQNQTLGFCTKLGCLLQPPAADSPARDGIPVLEHEADAFIDTANGMGCLGYVLASTNAGEAWSLLSGAAAAAATEPASPPPPPSSSSSSSPAHAVTSAPTSA